MLRYILINSSHLGSMASLHVSVMLIANPAPVFPSPCASWLLASQFLSGREEGEETSGETTKARRRKQKDGA